MGKEEPNKENKDDKKDFEPPTYTGEGFVPVPELVEIVKKWQQRKELCEEVDHLEQKGGSHLVTKEWTGFYPS